MARIRWSIRAQLDLQAVRDFLLRTSPTRTATTVSAIVRSVTPLSDFPNLGKVVPEDESSGLREVLAEGYRVLYRVTPEGDVEVAAIYHARQDLRRVLRNNPWHLS
jgi:plasmid stabilization system protein ParE